MHDWPAKAKFDMEMQTPQSSGADPAVCVWGEGGWGRNGSWLSVVVVELVLVLVCECACVRVEFF